MKVIPKNNPGFSPFNCIAMKDVKDKNSNKGDLRPLFDCVSSIGESIDKLHAFLDNSQDESGKIQGHVKTLTDIQMDLLSICQGKIAKQNEYIPGQDVEGGIEEEGRAQGEELPQTIEQRPLSLEKVPDNKPKIKV